jgi:hypothetical protein
MGDYAWMFEFEYKVGDGHEAEACAKLPACQPVPRILT